MARLAHTPNTDNQLVTTRWWEQFSSTLRACERQTVRVFVRSLAPTNGAHEYHKRVFEQCERATTAGPLDGYQIHVIGDGFCVCSDCLETVSQHPHIGKLAAIRQWQDEDIQPLGFDERTVDSAITGERQHVVVPPHLSLAVYRDDAIEGVFPCTIADDSYTVTDFLDTLTALAE